MEDFSSTFAEKEENKGTGGFAENVQGVSNVCLPQTTRSAEASSMPLELLAMQV